MSLRDAFRYSLKNIRRIIIISISLTIIQAILFEISNQTRGDESLEELVLLFVLFFGFLGISLAFILFCLGYGLQAIRHIQHGNNKLPSIQAIQNVGRGIAIGFGGIITSLPFFLVLILTSPFIILNGSIVNVFIFLILCPLAYYLISVYTIGIARYAKYHRITCLFEIQINAEYVHNNPKTSITFVTYFTLFAVLYLLTWSLIVSTINELLNQTTYIEFPIIWSISIFVSGILYLIFVLTVSHLIAQAGEIIGFDKNKNANKSHKVDKLTS